MMPNSRVPYQPLDLSSMMGQPEELPSPEALMVAEDMPQDPQMESTPQEQENAQSPTFESTQQAFLKYGLVGAMPQQDVDAVSQALADTIIDNQTRAEEMQKAQRQTDITGQSALGSTGASSSSMGSGSPASSR